MTVDPGLPDGMLLGADLGVLSKAQAYETFKHHTKPLSDEELDLVNELWTAMACQMLPQILSLFKACRTTYLKRSLQGFA